MEEDPLNRIDQELAEIDSLLTALIFISENVDDHQHELMRHSATSLCYIAHDKIAAAHRDVSRLLRMAA
ncbi:MULTISPECIES: hypothetical protein [unclassified Mesorhizobium]|uniref:hypothetical protein n=1 Tax=unclassified Mesorhizobium TaxID=325217 RepID=UPI0003CF4731|nr:MULTISPECIES: hypothetical protein [unclassified Mesorhizobium]ESY05362.1 hypothetical protein X752_26055 [Mesorhizobium sp. LNJC398B00]ESZ32728.1 hypothetical protein X732_28060 [Mesorhizobium sp. L2C066B000]